jgi:hypothetical protein
MNEHFEPYASEAFGPETMLTASIAISLKRLADHFTLEGKPGGESAWPRPPINPTDGEANSLAPPVEMTEARDPQPPIINPTDGREEVVPNTGRPVHRSQNERDNTQPPVNAAGGAETSPDHPDSVVTNAEGGAGAGEAPLTRSGWKLVPVEPTEEMLDAPWNHEENTAGAGLDCCKAIYQLMLSASPTPPEPDEGMIKIARDDWYNGLDRHIGTDPFLAFDAGYRAAVKAISIEPPEKARP